MIAVIFHRLIYHHFAFGAVTRNSRKYSETCRAAVTETKPPPDRGVAIVKKPLGLLKSSGC
jgi:hypothetical protein